MEDGRSQKCLCFTWQTSIWCVVPELHLDLIRVLTVDKVYAAAFFLLADHLRDAVNVCINQLGDIQLAITITRAYEGDDGPTMKEILEEKVLLDAASEGNRWLASWAFWMLNRRGMAVRSLIVSSFPEHIYFAAY
jgi:hypothetical protein